MKSIVLTEEDKNILRKVAKYLKSYNVRHGMIQIDWDDFNSSDFRRYLTNFSNEWSIEIPEFFKPYLFEFIQNTLSELDDLDIESTNYDNIEFDIAVNDQIFSATRYYGYEEAGDSNGMTWGDDTDDTEMVERILSEIRASDAEPNSDGIVRLNYNGSGDSGYVESSFDGGGRVPAEVEDWCYQRLENNFGGWEINEGSQGYFIFNLDHNIIELEHTNNTLVEESDSIFEEYFGK